jgi:hypothetical protein
MKLTSILKEVKAKQKLNEAMHFEFETDAQGNLEIYSPNHEDLLAVVDKESGNIDYNQVRMNDVQFSKSVKAQIMAAAERFLDDESDQSDSSAMYADRFSEDKQHSTPVSSAVEWLEEVYNKQGRILPAQFEQAKKIEEDLFSEKYQDGYSSADDYHLGAGLENDY